MAAAVTPDAFDPVAFNKMWSFDHSDPAVPDWQRAEWAALRAVLAGRGAPHGGCDPKYYMGALLNQLEKTHVFDQFADCKERITRLASDCQKLFDSIMEGGALSAHFKNFSNEKCPDILIPLGWRGDPDGHFLLCLVEVGDQAMQLHFYNAQPTQGGSSIQKKDLNGEDYDAWTLPIRFTCTQRFPRERLLEIVNDLFEFLRSSSKGSVTAASIYRPLCQGGQMEAADQRLVERDLRKRCVPLSFEMFVRSVFHASVPFEGQEALSEACDAFFRELKEAASFFSGEILVAQ